MLHALLLAAGGAGIALNAGALRDAGGHLAFVWEGKTYAVAARDGVAHRVALATVPAEMRWSDDGRSLEIRDERGDVWTARADGSGLRRVWVSPTDYARGVPACPDGVTLCGSFREPNGASVAYVVTPPYPNAVPSAWNDALLTKAPGNPPQCRYTAHGAGIELAGWFGGSAGVAFWSDPLHSASLAADGLQLEARRFGSAPRPLVTMLPYRDWIAWSPARDAALVVAGDERIAWHKKVVERCTFSSPTCVKLPRPAGTESLDPAWSARGEVAFVRAQDAGEAMGFSNRAKLNAWVRTRELVVARADGAGQRVLSTAGHGVYRPMWSANGERVLFMRDAALWSLREKTGALQRVLGPFPKLPDAANYYGQIMWSATVAWTDK